jgi:hypothetical protein
MLLFAGVCVVLRSCLVVLAAWLASRSNQLYLQVFGGALILVGILFAVKYSRYSVAKVGITGGPVWWNDLRLVHALLYGAFGLLAIGSVTDAWVILALDVLLGVVFTFTHYYHTTTRHVPPPTG